MAKSDSGNGRTIAISVAIIGAIGAIVAAFITSTGDGTDQNATPDSATPSTPNTCLAPQAANVSAFLANSAINFVIRISCPPSANSQYVLIGQPRGVDVDPKNPHPEYYIFWEMGQPTVGNYQRTAIDDLYTQEGAEVAYYIISVDDTGFAQLQAQKATPGDFVLKLPESHTVVSNRETVKR